uniref:6-carboxy-5,6,7,8-tetrahydropterin synthase n=1 Tax=Dictyoglomus turgidum TaxID=513050 RepID=A0A7C3SNL0_9BACT
MWKLKYKTDFSAAHSLKETSSLKTSKCKNLHGHNYFVEITIKTSELVDGMVIDFKELKEIIDELDHKFLNEFIENPTVENISKYIYDKVYEKMKKRTLFFNLEVEIKETENGSVIYSEDNL